jgi:hypothetical protein
MYYTLRTALPEILSNRDPAQEWFKAITSVRYVTETSLFKKVPAVTKKRKATMK